MAYEDEPWYRYDPFSNDNVRKLEDKAGNCGCIIFMIIMSFLSIGVVYVLLTQTSKEIFGDPEKIDYTIKLIGGWTLVIVFVWVPTLYLYFSIIGSMIPTAKEKAEASSRASSRAYQAKIKKKAEEKAAWAEENPEAAKAKAEKKAARAVRDKALAEVRLELMQLEAEAEARARDVYDKAEGEARAVWDKARAQAKGDVFANAEANDVYRKAKAEARSVFDKAIAEIKAARSVRDKVEAEASAVRDKARAEARSVFDKAMTQAGAVHDKHLGFRNSRVDVCAMKEAQAVYRKALAKIETVFNTTIAEAEKNKGK